MKDAVILELARCWEADADAVGPENQDDSEIARMGNAIATTRRQTKHECAEDLRVLVSVLGEKSE